MLGRFNDSVDIILRFLNHVLSKIMFIFIIAGNCTFMLSPVVTWNTDGNRYLIKYIPIYNSLFRPRFFFLTSAFAVGLTMIIFESMISCYVFGRKPEMHILTPLSKIIPYVLGLYVFVKLGDMISRGTYVFLFDSTAPVIMFWIEFGFLTVVPFFMFLSADVRKSHRGLFYCGLQCLFWVFY